MKLPKDAQGSVLASTFIRFVTTKVEYERSLASLKRYDLENRGFLLETELQAFVTDTVPSLQFLGTIDEDFVPFYAFGATKKIMFHLDPRRSGKVSIVDLVVSAYMRDFLSLAQTPLPASNWFSAESALTVYSEYLEMDEDNDGMLSLSDLGKVSHRWILTEAAISGLFAHHQTFNGSVDYRGYLDLVLALDNPDTYSGKKYLWNLLSSGSSMGCRDLRHFLSSTLLSLQDHAGVNYKPSDLCCEFMDMIGVGNDAIEFSHIAGHKAGGNFLKMLIDANAFFQYENRETLLVTDT